MYALYGRVSYCPVTRTIKILLPLPSISQIHIWEQNKVGQITAPPPLLIFRRVYTVLFFCEIRKSWRFSAVSFGHDCSHVHCVFLGGNAIAWNNGGSPAMCTYTKKCLCPPPPRRRRLKNVRPSSSEGFVADPSLKLRTTRWHHLDGIIRWRRRRRRRTPPKGEEEARKKSHYIGPCVTFFRGPRLCSGT